MANIPLSSDFIKKLVKKADDNLPRVRPVFTENEHTIIRTSVKAEAPKIEMRGKTFNVRYFTWKKEAWVTVRPERGFVPMFSSPVKQVLNHETEI